MSDTSDGELSGPAGVAKRVLGIEGGGTKTEWVLADVAPEGEPTVLRSGALPASNLKLTSDVQLARLFSVLPREAAHVGVFLAGCKTAEDRARLRGVAAAAWPHAALAIGSDRDSGMATAFRDGDGIIVIAGTGAAVHGRRSGREERAGGWGQLLGDRGSGYHLAMQGLRSVLSHFDLNDEISPLAQQVLRTLALNQLPDLVDWVMGADKMSVAQLAPAVFESARRGNPEMRKVVRDGAEVLAEFTNAVAQRLDFPDARVALTGGLFTHYPEYVRMYQDRLAGLLPGAVVSVCAESGALGAAWLAGQCRGAAAAQTTENAERDREGRCVPAKEQVERGAVSVERETAHAASAATPPLNRDELATAATEQSNPRSAQLDKLPTAELVQLFITEERRVEEALAACHPQLCAAVELVSAALGNGGRLFYIGAGTSGRLGVLDSSEIPPTFGASPELVQGIMAGGVTALHRAVEGAEDQPGAGALAVIDRGVRAGDVLCGIAASGRTPFVLGALERARALGAGTLLLTCNPARQRAAVPWDVEIDLPTGPELVTGSTRLKAGTATKLALNLLSTCAMIRLGKVRGNRMIDVRISNEKLRDRGARLVVETLGIPYADAMTRLERAGWNVRACVEAGKGNDE